MLDDNLVFGLKKDAEEKYTTSLTTKTTAHSAGSWKRWCPMRRSDTTTFWQEVLPRPLEVQRAGPDGGPRPASGEELKSAVEKSTGDAPYADAFGFTWAPAAL